MARLHCLVAFRVTDNGSIILPPPYIPPDTVVVPVAPSNLAVQLLYYYKGKTKAARIRVTWSDNSDNESGFRIIGGNLAWIVDPNVTSFDTDMPLGTWPFYVWTFIGDKNNHSAVIGPVTITLCPNGGGCSH